MPSLGIGGVFRLKRQGAAIDGLQRFHGPGLGQLAELAYRLWCQIVVVHAALQ